MKIGFDARCLLEPMMSGVPVYTKRMLEAFADYEPAKSAEWIEFLSGWSNLHLPNRLLNVSIAAFNWPTRAMLLPKADIVWQPNPMYFPSSDVPHFVTIHDLSFVHYPQFFSLRSRLWYLRWVKQWLKRAEDHAHLICISEATARDVLFFYPKWQNRLTVLSPPPPKIIFEPGESFNRFSDPYILSVATLEKRKNIEGIIAAFEKFLRQHPEFKLILAGRIGHLNRGWLNSAIKKFQGRVVLTGYVSTEERARLYSRALALVYPSFWEGYGYPPLEAMAAGTPVITSAVSALTENLGSAAIFINPDHTSEELFAALHILVQSPALWQKHQKLGLDHVANLNNNYSIEPLWRLWQNSV